MRLKTWTLLGIMCYCVNLHAQNWNLVWREDFGVAEDTVIKDFPNTSMTVPRHSFAAYESKPHHNNMGVLDYHEQGELIGDCGYIDDGQYGIANNTRWAYKRFSNCKNGNGEPLQDGGHFVAGKDHTGNKNGAMMIVNSEVGTGLPIYQQEIEFDLCDSREYKFVIYASSITTYNEEGGNANLELKVVNAKTGDIVKSIKTGDIPFWQFNGWGEDKGGRGDVTVQREWTEYATEPFTVNNGDRLQLQVTNWGSGYNDFAIDDISLYRNDDVEIIDPTISSNTISSENKAVAGSCIFNASFNVPESVLASWQKVYDKVYFLWQRSKDDGLTWNNELSVSGINQISADFEVSAEEQEVYRVIITGSASETEAKEQALYIAENGGPKDGCSYYSISNTLAGVSPIPDCSYQANLRTLWQDDLGLLSEEARRSSDDVKLKFYSGNTDALAMGEYAIVSNPETALENNSWDKEKALSDASGKPNGAMIYTKLDKSSGDDDQDLIYEKIISGNLCPCKSMCFSFFAYDRNEWAGETLLARVLTDKGEELGATTLEFTHDNSRNWTQCSVPFTLPQSYKGNIRLQILNKTKQNTNVKIALDNFSVYICGETAPQGTIQIDQYPTLAYLGGEDCGNAANTLSINDDTQWKKSYPNYGFAWQKSSDHGVTWSFVGNGKNITHQNSKGDLTEYRIVFAETQEAAEQAAQKGLPDDPCTLFGYSNRLAIECKTEPCKAPQFELKGEESQTICNDRTEPIIVKVAQQDDVNIDKMQWFSKLADETKWVAIEAANDSTLSIETFNEGITDYLFLAFNDTCTSDSILFQLEVHPKIILISNDTTVCEGSDLTLKANVAEGSSVPTEYIWNDTKSTIGEANVVNVKAEQEVTLTANDGVCFSEEVAYRVLVEELYQPVWNVDEVTGCKDSTEGFLFIAKTADNGKAFYESHTSAWVQNGETIGEEFSLEYTFTENTTLTHIVTGTYCPAVSYDFNIEVVNTPILSLQANSEQICEGEDLILTATTEHAKNLIWHFLSEEASSDKIIDQESLGSIKIQPQKSGAYHISTPDDGICGKAKSNMVYVKVEKALDFEFESIPSIICEGTDIQLSATQTSGEAITTQWCKDDQKISDKLSLQDQPSESCTYQFKAVSEVCPTFTKSFEVTISNPVQLVLSTQLSKVCKTDGILLNTENSDIKNLQWQSSTNGKDFTTFAEEGVSEQTFKEITAEKYYFRLAADNGTCGISYSDTVEVAVIEPLDYEMAEIPASICAGEEVNLSATKKGGQATTISWSRNDLTISDKLETTDAPTENATYTFTAQSEVCPTFSTQLEVTVDNPSSLTLSANADLICQGSPITLTTEVGETKIVRWQQSSDGITYNQFSESLENSLVYETTEKGDLYFRLESENEGRCKTGYSNIVKVEVEQPISVDLKEKQTICEGEEVTIEPTITGHPKKIAWFKRDKEDDEPVAYLEEKSSFSVAPSQSTEYTMVYESSSCPSGEVSTVVVVESISTLAIELSEDSICGGTAVSLSTDYPNEEQLIWEHKENGTYTRIEKGSALITVFPNDTEEYRVSATSAAGCEATPGITTVHVFQPSDITLEEKTICLGDSVRMNAKGAQNGATLMWFTSDDNYGNSFSDQSSVVLKPQFTTDYKVVVMNGKCVNEASTTVTITTPPVVLSCEEISIGTYELEVESAVQPLTFDYGTGPSSSNRLENVTYGRKYDIIISNESGCATLYTLETPLYDIAIPEYFIPSQGNWVVENLNRFPNSTVKIHDRFGKVLVELKSDTEGWDGTYNGHALPSTDYWYIINVPEIRRIFTGHFTLIREK